MSMPMSARIGYRGEQLTVQFLRKKGYTIKAVNFATSAGETDIIAQKKDGPLCFVEVKTRMEGQMFDPADSVDAEKKKRLTENALRYLQLTFSLDCPVRFDIAEITVQDMYSASLNYIKDAFSFPKG